MSEQGDDKPEEKPKDSDAVALAKLQAKQERQARKREEAAAAAKQNQFNSSLGTAYDTSVAEARNYFLQRGLNPDDYMPAITSAGNIAKGHVPNLDATPSTYFDGLGEQAYQTSEGAKRGEFSRQIDSFAPSGFERRRVADTADDAARDAILAEQRANADMYIQNLLKRGVINQTGYQGAARDLDQQRYGAQARLDEIGGGLINTERDDLVNLANSARENAANYKLGTSFNPFDTSRDIDTSVSTFLGGLGDRLRGLIPADLFKTSGLPSVAGAAMGAQNLKFDPRALAGDLSQDDDDDETNFLSAF